MNRRLGIGAVAAVCALSAGIAHGADRVRLTAGNQYSGELVETSPTKVVFKIGVTQRDFAVNEIDSVQFDAEPTELTQARALVRSGRYDDAAKMIAKITPTEMKRLEVARDVEFYRSAAAARQALSGNGSIANAGKLLFAFEKANPNSYHYYEACELLGDLLVALGNFPVAETYYAKVAAAPWPEYQMRANLQLGRALVAQKKFEQATARFDDVLKAAGSGDSAQSLKSGAMLGKASALVNAGRNDEAVKLVEEIVAKADPKDEELFARAYNLLGNSYVAAGKPDDAIVAFLHVDLLYSRVPELHAEALANLAKLFAAKNKTDRANEARNLLLEKYPNSTWAAN
jgi:tetratricopeptide (TPR) repeat protein